MLRRLLAVIVGFATCQISMIVCLALALGVLAAFREMPWLALLGVGALLAAPGLIGGALAGFLTDQFGWFYGAATGNLFGMTTVLIKLVLETHLALTFGVGAWSPLASLGLVLVLTSCGALGGILGHRRRAGRRAPVASSRRSVTSGSRHN